MAVVALDHVNLRTTRLEEMRRFYVEVLGLRVGPRPNFSFGGLWLYCGDVPVVHLVVVDEPRAQGSTSSLQHFAFRATNLREFRERLEALGYPAPVRLLRDFDLCQVKLTDPEGNPLHVDFPLAEARALGIGDA